jgi:hypothetical protein
MAVGRITGPLLAKNLLRDGVDLAFETDLLYLDVNTGRIGIKTANPQYTLDVNGDTNVLSLRVATTSTLGNLLVYPKDNTTYVTNTVGDLIIGAPLEQQVIITSDTLVQGNLHATGNISAEGSVQIGNITGSDTLSLYADIVSDITPQTSSTYDLGAPGLSWGNAYVDTLIAQTLTGPLGKEINITPDLNQLVNIKGNVRIYGNNPLGTAAVTQNTLYVNMDGSDTNDGGAIDATRACRTIGGALKSPLYKAGTSIKVSSGRYLENNPLRLKPFTSIIGSDLRTTVVEPINKTQDLFWVDSGCYIAQMLMANGQSGLLPGTGYTAGTNRGAYATAFPPNYGGEKIYITHSPYIQNCTNQSGPWLNDGTLFQPNQTIQIPEAVATATWVANTTTLMVTVEEGALTIGQSINSGPTKPGYVNARTLLLANKAFFQEQLIAYIDDKYSYFGYNKTKCIRDTGYIVDSLVTDLLFSSNGYTQSNFSGLQYWNQNGYTGIINTEITTTTNAIKYVNSLAQKIVQNITTGTRYNSTVTQTIGTAATTVEAAEIATEFDLIVRIINSGTNGVSDIVNPNGTDVLSINAQHAADLLLANKAYLQAEAVAYVESTKTLGFVYDPVKCYRDVGYMIDSVAFDILYGGNRQAIQSGVYYYGFSTSDSAVDGQIPQTTAAYFRIREIVGQIITNQAVTKSPGNGSVQVTNLPAATATEAVPLRAMIDLITDIIGAGPDAALTPAPVGLIRSANPNVLKAINLLKANKSFIISEVISFIDSRYNNGFPYNSIKCARDTGLIVDSIAIDLLYLGDTQSTFAGLQYWNQADYTGEIKAEVTATVAAINYVSSLAEQVILGSTGQRYQNTATQVFGTTATLNQALIAVEEFGIIANIVKNGTRGVSDLIIPNGLTSTATAFVNAFNILQANKSYIQSEAVAFVNSQNKIFDTVKCARDTGLIVDAIAQDLLFTTSSQSIFAGLQYWNQQDYSNGIGSKITTTTNAISYVRDLAKKIVENNTTGIRYSTGTQITALPAASTVEANIIATDFNVLLNILNVGTTGVSDIIVPNGLEFTPDPNKIKAYNLLQANKIYLQQEAVAFIEATKNITFTYDPVKSARDISYIVDAVSFDLAYSGNRQVIQLAVYYYDFTNQTAIPGQISNTTLAYNKIKELLPYVIRGSGYPFPLQTSVSQVVSASTGTAAEVNSAQASVDLITNIINNGPSAVAVKTPMRLTPSANARVVNAASLIEANRSFLVAEVIAYISNPTEFVYDGAKCYRDVGYMIDCVSFDLIHGGNRQAVTAGVYYYNFDNGSTAIVDQIPQTIAAYKHIRNIVGKIVTNTVITPTAGNTATQVTLVHPATLAEAQTLYSKLDIITNIITNGPSVAEAPQPVGLIASTSTEVTYAYNLLTANRSFIQQEVIAFIDQFQPGFVYNRAKCRRDIGIVVENIAYDIAFGGNEKSRESGLAYWDGVTSVISGQIPQSVDAFTYLGTLAQSIVTNTTATNILNTYQTAPQVINTVLTDGGVASGLLPRLVGIITNIITNGPDSAPVRQSGNGPDWGSVSAEVLLQTNKSFIQNEVINWISNTYPYLEYREDKCYRDTGLIIDAVTQDIVLNANAKSIEAGVTYWTGNQNVLANSKYGQVDQVAETVAAINHVRDVALQVINNTTVTSIGFNFSSGKCYRDTGLIVDGLAQDLLFGGNSQSTFSGIQYWNHGTYTGDLLQQITTTTAAISYVRDLAKKIVQNNTSGIRYQSTTTQNTSLPTATLSEANTVGTKFDTILNILNNGVTGVTDAIVPNSISPSGNVNIQKAYNLLQANIDYLKAEAIGFVEANKSFRYDKTKCARDTGLIVDSVVIDLAYPTEYQSQSTFAGLQYWNQGAYTGQIAREITTTTNAIDYLNYLAQAVVQNIPNGTRYQNTLTQQLLPTPGGTAQVNYISDEFNLIKNIILTGTNGISDVVVANLVDPSSDVVTQAAYNLLQTNRDYIISEVIAFVEATKTPGFVYDATLWAGNTGNMIDAVSFDLLHGGNRQAIQTGVYYYSFDETSTAIPDEQAQTIAAFQFVKSLCSRLAQNLPITPLQTRVLEVYTPIEDAAGISVEPKVFTPVEKIIRIIKNGPGVVGYKTPVSLVPTYDIDKYRAAKILQANKEFIKAETIAFIDQRLSFQYDPVTCARDVGYIVNSVSFDVLYGGNRQSIQSGVYYWGYTLNSTALPKERQATTLAYEYMKKLVDQIVAGTPIATTYQNTVTQNISYPAATDIEIATLNTSIDLITKIINEGPSVVKAKTPIGQVASNNQFVRNAVNSLIANRQFIQAEVVSFVAETLVGNPQIILPFYDKGADATLGVIRNFDLIANIITNGPGVAPTKSDGNGIFVSMGLTVDDVKVAPIITAITPLGGNKYQVDINQSTTGYGDDQTLYFGQTLVFPLQDKAVPDRWQQRRVNPIGSMGGSLVDGGVVSERSQINSFVYDAFTQVNQGGVGVRITNNGYAQLVSVFTIFCSQSVVA